MGIIVFLFVLIFFNSLCFGQATQTGTNRVMIKGEWVDVPVFTIKGGSRSYDDAHPEERAWNDAIQANKPLMDMYQKDIMKASPPPSDEAEKLKRKAREAEWDADIAEPKARKKIQNSYQTRDAFGNIVNSGSNYQTRDAFGNIVNSGSNYQTKDAFGNIVNKWR